MKKFFSIVLLFVTVKLFAQAPDASKYAAIISTNNLKKHLTIIAGDEFEGRETGTEGQRKAGAYIEKQFAGFGLQKAKGLTTYQQLYPLFKDSVVQSQLTLDTEAGVIGTDFLIPLNNNSSATLQAKEVVFVGYGIDDENYSDYKKISVKGKVVCFVLGEPKKEGKYFINKDGIFSKWTYPGLEEKLALAKAKGAKAALVINPTMEKFSKRMVDNNSASGISFESLPKATNGLPYALVAHAYAKKLFGSNVDSAIATAKAKNTFSKKLKFNKLPVNYAFEKKRTIIDASNVVGIVEGTDKKDEFVFLTAHYDHLGKHDGKIYYGADDDGSGTCAVIAMAEAFAQAAKEGVRPRRTVVFMTVSGEEKGLWGSEYYSDHPIYDLNKTSVDLNIDMIGRIDTERTSADSLNYVYVVGHDKISTELPIINEGINNKHSKIVLDYKFDDPEDKNQIYFRSDHYNFARKGVPVLFFYDGMLKSDYHKPTDTVDKIYWDLYAKRAQMIFYTAWEMANREAMLVRDKPLDGRTRQ
jgi:Zn-dependent M28 family amino/carboxypeptidase